MPHHGVVFSPHIVFIISTLKRRSTTNKPSKLISFCKYPQAVGKSCFREIPKHGCMVLGTVVVTHVIIRATNPEVCGRSHNSATTLQSMARNQPNDDEERPYAKPSNQQPTINDKMSTFEPVVSSTSYIFAKSSELPRRNRVENPKLQRIRGRSSRRRRNKRGMNGRWKLEMGANG